MPELKFAKTRRLRRFEGKESKEKRIEFQRLTSNYQKRSMLGLVVMGGMIAYILYYLSQI